MPATRQRTQIATSTTDYQLFRSVMGRFCTGIAVITSHDDTGPIGIAVQSLVSVSKEPPLVSFCPQRTSTSWPRIAKSGVFCANILSGEQHSVSAAFGASGLDKFRDVDWTPAPSGAPILMGNLAYIDCEVVAVHEAGDHQIVVGQVTTMATADIDDDPLLFYRGRYGRWSASLTSTPNTKAIS